MVAGKLNIYPVAILSQVGRRSETELEADAKRESAQIDLPPLNGDLVDGVVGAGRGDAGDRRFRNRTAGRTGPVSTE